MLARFDREAKSGAETMWGKVGGSRARSEVEVEFAGVEGPVPLAPRGGERAGERGVLPSRRFGARVRVGARAPRRRGSHGRGALARREARGCETSLRAAPQRGSRAVLATRLMVNMARRGERVHLGGAPQWRRRARGRGTARSGSTSQRPSARSIIPGRGSRSRLDRKSV